MRAACLRLREEVHAGDFFCKNVLKLFLLSFTTLAFAGHLCAEVADGRRNANRFEGSFAASKTLDVERIPTIRN